MVCRELVVLLVVYAWHINKKQAAIYILADASFSWCVSYCKEHLKYHIYHL